MRILHVSSVYPPDVTGGAEIVVEMLAEAQARRGHQVGAAYLARAAEPARSRHGVTILPQATRNLLWIDDVFRQPRLLRTANKIGQLVNYRAASDFSRAIAAFRPDIVHTHSMVELPPMVWDRIADSGAKSVHTLHDYDLLCSRASLFRDGKNCEGLHASCRVTAQWKARFARRIDAVAAVSRPVLDTHHRFGLFHGLTSERARVIWNAVPAAGTGPRERLTNHGPFVFGFLGRLVPEKGIDTLISACRALPPDGWRLKVAGRAQEGDSAYREKAAGLPIDFLGFTEPQAFLRSIDVLVVPPIWREPFGLTVIEAFAQGVPVIGSRIGAIADLVATIDDDWLVPAGDPEMLAARMKRALTQGREALPQASAFSPVLTAVSVERMLDGYDALYGSVLAREEAA
ncbi:glycosyltransferase family 4 protein [Sphingomonas sp. PL-96]|uniref:glycosyltransferase family 4 protein n=1 Tax=Sphingomonas sp. PL-96 TaxID=2887201 RepID=UPI001E2EAB39|nr:glycosyltransferase family 4 protein [Sphingomonas sp. PL-96]MCC2976602.1 glycosyltransferase family 4 protein [Sphingomonas sp. PL-96]